MFCTLAADGGWNQLALVNAFYSGLSDLVKDRLISVDLLAELDTCVALVSKIDKRLSEHDHFHNDSAFMSLSLKPRVFTKPVTESPS